MKLNEIKHLLYFYSYAREWQAKLRELQECNSQKANANINSNNLIQRRRSPSKDFGNHLNALLPLPPGLTPSVSITASKRSSPQGRRPTSGLPDFPPIKMDSNGALNLASSPSPPASDYTASSTADISVHGNSPTRRSPQPAQRHVSSFGVEMCVVCGDRASGKTFDLMT
jgi:hypothetical protein